jgi:hypothetical protein
MGNSAYHFQSTTPATATQHSARSGSSSYLFTLSGGHSHSFNHTHINGENYPEWVGLIPVSPDTDVTEIPSGICGFFKGSTVPSGWSLFSSVTGKFVQGKSATDLTGSGANTHSHPTLSLNSGYYNNDYPGASGSIVSQANNTSGHYHSASHGHSDLQDNQPPFQELMFLKKD